MEKNRYKVLQIFGVPVEVNNPRLAEILVLDAREVLGTDLVKLPEVMKKEGLVPTAESQQSSDKDRGLLLSQVETMGSELGFDVSWQGVWRSPVGMLVAIRMVDRVLPLEQAKKSVVTLAEQLDKLRGENAGLLVVSDQLSLEIFKIAIQSKNYCDRMRVCTTEVLSEMRDLRAEGRITHAHAVSLLIPLASVNVGSLLEIAKDGKENKS